MNTWTKTRENLTRNDGSNQIYTDTVGTYQYAVPTDVTVIVPKGEDKPVEVSIDNGITFWRLAPACVFGVAQGGVSLRTSISESKVEVGFRAGAIRAPAVIVLTQAEEDGGEVTMNAPLGAECTLYYNDSSGVQVMENITCGAGDRVTLKRTSVQIGSTAVLVGKLYL